MDRTQALSESGTAAVRLSSIWFFFLAGVGMFYPFYALYLRDITHLSGTQIGLVMAVMPLVGIFSQPLWGYIADRSGRRVAVLTVLALGAALGYELLVFPKTFAGIVFGTLLLAFFSTALLPAAWSVTLAFLAKEGMHAVGRARVCGTIGFALSAVSFPYVAGASLPADDPSRLSRMFPLAAGLVAIAAVIAAALPRRGDVTARAERGDVPSLLRHAPFLRVLVVVFLAFLCVQGPMSIFPLLVQEHGGGAPAISRMWILMLSLEIPLIAGFGSTVTRLGLRAIVLIGIVSAAIRWLTTGFASNTAIITAVQGLHGVAVWGLMLGTPAYVDAIVPARLRSTAQGVLGTVGFGIASVISSAAAGWLTEHSGATAPSRFAGIGALLLGIAARWVLPEPGC